MIYDTTKYRKIDWKHFMMFHWIINPGIVAIELMGMRIPKIMLIERANDKKWIERGKVPCPHCNTIHDGKTWSPQNKTAYKNWFGLYCPACGGVIPCLINITTFLILLVTAPVWYWFKDSWKKSWLQKQPARYENLDFSMSAIPKTKWVLNGFIWGVFMFIVTDLVDVTDEPANFKKLAFSFVWWSIWGIFGFGWVMHLVTSFILPKKEKN